MGCYTSLFGGITMKKWKLKQLGPMSPLFFLSLMNYVTIVCFYIWKTILICCRLLSCGTLIMFICYDIYDVYTHQIAFYRLHVRALNMYTCVCERSRTLPLFTDSTAFITKFKIHIVRFSTIELKNSFHIVVYIINARF